MKSIFNYNIVPVVIILASFFFACDERTVGIGGNRSIEGRVVINDTLSSLHIPVAGAEVRISKNLENPADFIFSVTTDADGYFKFSNLNLDDEDMMIYSTYTRKTKNHERHYKDSIIFNNVKKNQKNQVLHLKPDADHGNYFLRISTVFQDILNNNKTNIAPATSLRIYSKTDSVNQIQATSTNDGIIDFPALKAGTYRVRGIFKQKYENTEIEYSINQDLLISGDDTEIFKEIQMAAVPKTRVLFLFVNEDEVTVQPKASYCLYTNQYFFEESKCSSTTRSGIANVEGKVLLGDVVAGSKLYIRAYDSLGNTLGITAATDITVLPNILNQKKIILKNED